MKNLQIHDKAQPQIWKFLNNFIEIHTLKGKAILSCNASRRPPKNKLKYVSFP
jgi:hypothetical protein